MPKLQVYRHRVRRTAESEHGTREKKQKRSSPTHKVYVTENKVSPRIQIFETATSHEEASSEKQEKDEEIDGYQYKIGFQDSLEAIFNIRMPASKLSACEKRGIAKICCLAADREAIETINYWRDWKVRPETAEQMHQSLYVAEASIDSVSSSGLVSIATLGCLKRGNFRRKTASPDRFWSSLNEQKQ